MNVAYTLRKPLVAGATVLFAAGGAAGTAVALEDDESRRSSTAVSKVVGPPAPDTAADAKARAEADAQAAAEAKARMDADLQAKSEVEAKTAADVEAKTDAEARARAAADDRARAEAHARSEADARAAAEARANAEADAKAAAEARARAEADATAAAEARAKAEAAAKAAEAAHRPAKTGTTAGGTYSGDLDGWIAQARAVLKENGDKVPSAAAIKARAMTESSGNPKAENHWDSNEALYGGTFGLMQTIRPTFDAFALPGHTDIFNPVDSIIAGVRYANDRYGDFEKIAYSKNGY